MELSVNAVCIEAQEVRKVLEAESRSTTLVRLFDFLLDHSANARAPKEIEIAMLVFGKDSGFDTSQDSMVRVYMHRLRNRMDSFYAGRPGPRLVIPKGEYRIILTDTPADVNGVPPSDQQPAAQSQQARTIFLAVSAVLTVSAMLWTSFFVLRYYGDRSSPLAHTHLWRSFAADTQPPLIVAGDSYMFVQSPDGKEVRRMIMQTSIRSENDLAAYLVSRPQGFSQLHDLDIYYMSANTAAALWSVMSVMSEVCTNRALPSLLPASRLTAETLNANNIFFVGRVDELSLLRSLVSDISGFAFDDSSDEVRDRMTGKTYIAKSGGRAADGSPVEYGYGYIASFPGSSGQKITIVAGIRDVAVSQMIKLISNPPQLGDLAVRVNDNPAFEALYEVRSVGGLRFSTRLLVARRLKGAN